MIYLILKIFVYMGFALALGGAAGWLLRQFTAQKQEDQLRRDLADSRAKVPQLESLIRARDQKIRTLSQQVGNPDSEGQGSRVQDEQLMRQLREHELEIQRLKGQLAEAHTAAADGLISGEALLNAQISQPTQPGSAGLAAGDAAASAAELAERDALIASLQRELEQAKEQLAGARIQLELVGAQQDYQREAQELGQRLRQRAEEQERLKTQIEQEQRRVLELERERELQAKSLKVLHQQLELARANPAVPRS